MHEIADITHLIIGGGTKFILGGLSIHTAHAVCAKQILTTLIKPIHPLRTNCGPLACNVYLEEAFMHEHYFKGGRAKLRVWSTSHS